VCAVTQCGVKIVQQYRITSITFYVFLKSVQTGDYRGGYAVNNSLTYTLVTVTPPPSTSKPEEELFLWYFTVILKASVLLMPHCVKLVPNIH